MNGKNGKYFVALSIFILLCCMACEQRPEKIGILCVHVGTPEQYDPAWVVPFFNNIYDYFPPGFFAGGNLEGGNCYTVIHYANEAEADICDVAPGTPIDMFCNEYSGDYSVSSMLDRRDEYGQQCYSPYLIPFTLALSDSTVDPLSGEVILGPHIHDPNGSGIGIADFLEVVAFDNMDAMHRRPGKEMPHREQYLRWVYGNDAPGYEPVDPEPINIKAMLSDQVPDRQFVFRHGWEIAPENHDIYGNPADVEGSLETAIHELIEVERVDTIIVFHPTPYYSNSTHFGHEGWDLHGNPVSRVPGQSFMECVEDIDGPYGPSTAADLQSYITWKPWEKHADHVFPVISRLTADIKPRLPVIFAEQTSAYAEAAQASSDMVSYIIDKYAIPDTASLKVITTHHGFSRGYMNSQECDYYFLSSEDFMAQSVSAIQHLLSDWVGKVEVVSRPLEFAEGSIYDLPTASSPLGSKMSAAEEVDQSINGLYVNALGNVVDNGNDNFDYIIVQHNNIAESEDTLFGMREEIFGNHIYESGNIYVRDETAGEDREYNASDVDEDFITLAVFDATRWPSKPGCVEDPEGCQAQETVYKGSALRPTTVLLGGSYLGNTQGAGRNSLTTAAVKTIIDALDTSTSTRTAGGLLSP